MHDYLGVIKLQSIKVEKITVSFDNEVVIRDLSMEYRGNGLIQILGPNGAGKTTLLKTILGFIKPIHGKIYINDIDVTGKPGIVGRFVGYVPQITGSIKIDYPLTLYEFVKCCYILKKRWPRLRSNSVHEIIEKTLQDLGLPREKWNKLFNELSGGEKQRGFIARALVNDPEILLMDEPFSNIDPEGRIEIAEKIIELSRSKLVIITSHDPTLLLPHTNRILLINRHIYYYGEPHEVLKSEIISKIYGKAYVEVGKKHIHIIDSHF